MHQEEETPFALSSEQLAPIRAWVHANPGSISKLAEMMAEKSGHHINRNMVSRWLAQEPTKRTQPIHGNALLLERCVRELQTQKTK